MVPAASFLCMALAGLLAVILPLVVVIVLLVKKKVSVRSVLIGAAVFFVVQVMFRMTALNVLSLLPAWQSFAADHFVFYALFLAFTAGLVEEFGRYGAFRLFLKGRADWRTGLGYGLGHGGFESLYLMGSATLNNVLLSLMLNAGVLDQLAGSAGAEAVAQIEAQLAGTPSWMFLLGGVERIFAIAFHLALSQVVLWGVRDKRFSLVFLAVLLHTAFNFVSVLVTQYAGVLWGEASIALMAVVSVIFLWYTRKKEGKEKKIA